MSVNDRMDYLLRDSLHAGVAYGHYVFVDPEIRDRAKSFLNEHRDSILKTAIQKEE